jgi:hypothetical protein
MIISKDYTVTINKGTVRYLPKSSRIRFSFLRCSGYVPAVSVYSSVQSKYSRFIYTQVYYSTQKITIITATHSSCRMCNILESSNW